MQNVPQQVIGFIEIENVHPTGLEADEGFLLLAPQPGQVESKGDLSNDQSADNGQPVARRFASSCKTTCRSSFSSCSNG